MKNEERVDSYNKTNEENYHIDLCTKSNLCFIITHIIMLTICIVCIVLQILGDGFLDKFDLANGGGIAIQVAATIAVCVVTIILIPLNIPKETAFGLTAHEYEKMRRDIHYCLPVMISICFIMITIGALCLFFKWYFLSMMMSLCLAALAVMEVFQNIRLIQKDKSVCLQIIIDCYKHETDVVHNENIKKAIKNALFIDTDYNLMSLYAAAHFQTNKEKKQWLRFLLHINSQPFEDKDGLIEQCSIEGLTYRFLKNSECFFFAK